MPINADKPQLWKADTRASVDQFNQWFMKFAPKAYRETRKKTIASVETGLVETKDLTVITPETIKSHPGILPTLRMSTCPPLARDRLIGLADASKNLVKTLEEGKLPPLINPSLLEEHLKRIVMIISQMLDVDIFPWLERKRRPTEEERYRSSTIVAVIQPKRARLPRLPILIEAKAAGDFTNVNKRRKEEATKINQLKATFGAKVVFVLFLCGYFDAAYLGYEAAEGIDWIWEHRPKDLDKLGI